MTVEVQIGEFVAPVKVNPYAPVIEQLAAAGENAAATLTVDAADVSKTARNFGDAANDQGYTAKRRSTSVNGAEVSPAEVRDLDADTQVSLVFTLGPKQVRPGRPRKDAAETSEPKAKK